MCISHYLHCTSVDLNLWPIVDFNNFGRKSVKFRIFICDFLAAFPNISIENRLLSLRDLACFITIVFVSQWHVLYWHSRSDWGFTVHDLLHFYPLTWSSVIVLIKRLNIKKKRLQDLKVIPMVMLSSNNLMKRKKTFVAWAPRHKYIVHILIIVMLLTVFILTFFLQ